MPEYSEYGVTAGGEFRLAEFELSKTRRFVFLATGFRVLGLAAAFLDYSSLSSQYRRTSMESLAVVIISLSLIMMSVLLSRKYVQLVYSRLLAVCDLGLGFSIILLEAKLIAPHQLFNGFEDLFSVVLVSAAVLWTFIYGLKLGVAIAVAYVPIQILMAHINGYALGSIDWAELFARVAWLSVGVYAGYGVQVVNRFVEQLVGEEAERSGRLRALRQMHDRALQELSVIIMETDPADDPSDRLASVGNRARNLNSYLRSWFETEESRSTDSFHDELQRITAECESSSQVSFSLVTLHDEHRDLCTEQASLLLEAVRAACWNIVLHSCATMATVKCSEVQGDLVLTIYDDGRGFDPNQPLDGVHLGVSTIQRLLEQIGGTTRLATSLDGGTKWTLSCPL